MISLFGRNDSKTLAPQEIEELLNRNAIHLVDVREANEWNEGHIPGAIHQPPFGTGKLGRRSAN